MASLPYQRMYKSNRNYPDSRWAR